MQKPAIVAALISELKDGLHATINAQRDAADYATNDESRAREKYETQSTEASYLARGQAAHAEELALALEYFETHQEQFSQPHTKADLGSLVEVDLNGYREWLFIAKKAGGHAIPYEGHEVTVITPESPVGGQLLNQVAGIRFSLPNGAPGKLLAVY